MTYAIYTRSHPADTDCKADREQYQRYVAMVEETIEQVLPQTEEECPNEMRIPKRLCRIIPIRLLCPQTERPTVCKICLKISALGRSMAS